MPRKKNDPEKPDTSEDTAKEPEQEEVGQSEVKGKDDTPEFAAEQSEAMSEILDDEPEDLNELAKQPAEKDKEQDSLPESEAQGKDKPEDKQPDSKEAEPELAAKDEVKPDEKEKEPDKTKPDETGKETPEDKSLDITYEVIEPDGVKQVPVKNLITTYQQFGNLQKRHTAIKPLFELMEKANQPVEMLYPYLEVGIAYMQQVQGAGKGEMPQAVLPGIKAQVPQPEIPEQKPGEYQGPFESEEKDDYYKEVDPDLHNAMWRMWNVAIQKSQTPTASAAPDDITQRVSALEQASQQIASERQQTYIEDGKREIDNRINQWVGPHNDYFKEASKGNERLEGFRNFIIGRYPDTKIKELTPEFLSAVFAAFDPVYYNQYLQNLAANKSPENNESGTFSESSGVRQPSVKLTEQEECMAELM
jgi:hypothetical protein